MTIADLKIVRAAIWEARAKCFDIGIELNITVPDLDVIRENKSGDIGSCFTEMLILWLKRLDPPPTWSSLVDALKEPTVNIQQVAKQLQKMFIAEDSSGLSAEVAELSFPYIANIAPDERAREELEHRLRMESKAIITQFRILQNKFLDSIEKQGITASKLVQYLDVEITNALKQQTIDTNPTTVDAVKEFIKKSTSFYDYELIRYMIELTGTNEDKDQLKQYEEAFLVYAKRRVYECPAIFHTSGDHAKTELHVKLDSMYDDHKLKELKDFQYRLWSILNISVYICHLKSIEKGCFLLTFLIPYQIQKTVFPLSDQQEKALVELGVRQLICGDYQFPRDEVS